MSHKVGIVGLGNIAGIYGEVGEAAPYSHAGGLESCKTVHFAAGADHDPKALERFRAKWSSTYPDLHYFDTFARMLDQEHPDIIGVCVRGPDHFDVMMQAIAASPKAIFLEKPPSCSLEQMDVMVAAAKKKNIPITVSYSRHWARHVMELEKLVKDGLIGQVRMVLGYVGGNVLSFASHTTDLICQFAGYCPTAVYARGSVPKEAPEGYLPEPQLDSMVIEFANGIRGVQVGCDTEYGGFYADVIGTEGMVRAGIYLPPFGCNRKYEPFDFTKLAKPFTQSVFTVAYDQIGGHLAGGPPPSCTNEDFITVHEIGFATIESILTDRRIELPNVNRTRKFFANG